MNTARRFEGKVALITGGASGIGRAVGLRLTREGANVAVADIDPEGGRETVRQMESEGGKAIFIEADVTVPEANEKMIAETVRTLGRLDVLVPSAGIGSGKSVTEITTEDWDRVVDLDLRAVFLACKQAVPHMQAGGGAIVLISSIGGLCGSTGAAFAAAKGGVVNFTRSLAVAHAKENVRVNCVCPGYVATPIIQRILDDPERLARIASLHPMGRIGRAEEVAAAIAFLASDEASFITGAILTVDGGFCAAGPAS